MRSSSCDAVVNIFHGRAFGLVPGEFHVGFLERAAEAAHAVAVLADIAALGFVQDVAGVFAGIAEGFEQGEKFLDGLLEVNIVFPERIVGIDQNGFSGHDFGRAGSSDIRISRCARARLNSHASAILQAYAFLASLAASFSRISSANFLRFAVVRQVALKFAVHFDRLAGIELRSQNHVAQAHGVGQHRVFLEFIERRL